MQATRTLLLQVVLLAAIAHQAGSWAPKHKKYQQFTEEIPSDQVKYERGDCLYETVVCLRDDSCGPLLRLVFAYCYETPGYQLKQSDGSRLACDSSCAVLLSVLFNTSAGLRLRECNHSNYQFWSDLVLRKQLMCAPLLAQTDRLLQRVLTGAIRTECWLAGLLCARDFPCRSTLMGILDLPCYDGPCSSECSARLNNFGSMFSEVFHTFVSCLCGPDLTAACPTIPSGYLSNRSAALDSIGYSSPLDGLIEQLGREAIKEQMGDSMWLLRVFEHSSYCRGLKAIISDANCVPQVHPKPTVNEPICMLESVYYQPATSSTAQPSSTSTSTRVSTVIKSTHFAATTIQSRSRLTKLQLATAVYPKGAAASDTTEASTGAQQLESPAAIVIIIFCSLVTTKLTLCLNPL